MVEILLLSMGLGAVAGFLAGLLGIGGGLIIVPALFTLFSMQQFPAHLIMLLALATSLATITVTSLAATLTHHRLGAVLWPRVCRLTPGLVIGTVLGSMLANQLPTASLRLLCAGYMLVVGLQMALKLQPVIPGLGQSKRQDSIAGVIIGGMAALVGIGGGSLSVPYLLSCRLPMKNAVAVSSACGFPIAVFGTLSYTLLGWQAPLLPAWSIGYVYMPAFLGIVTISMLTAPLGAKLTHTLPTQTLKNCFSVVLFGVAFKLLWR